MTIRILFSLGWTIGALACQVAPSPAGQGLWGVYEQSLKSARYIDLTHTITPSIPVWRGFGPATFGPTVNPETGKAYTYEKDGFAATAYRLSTGQYGSRQDPPGPTAPGSPATDGLRPTYAVRPLEAT